MENSLYTDEVKQYIHTRPWPRGLVMDVFEDDDPVPHLNFIFYRDNFIKFDTDAQKQIASIIQEIMTKLRKDGIPCYMGRMKSVPTA